LRPQSVRNFGLDVLANEPPPPDDPVMGTPNLLLSPHFAWYSEASERRARTMTVDGLLDYLEKRPLRGGRLAVDP
jgi:D-3-phosphoglycerate dehydrogenase / 2-oxoglutarate reductase